MNEIKLKPCPFCGGKAKLELRSFDVFISAATVVCTKCGARTNMIKPSCDYTAKDKAFKLWNRRVKEQDNGNSNMDNSNL